MRSLLSLTLLFICVASITGQDEAGHEDGGHIGKDFWRWGCPPADPPLDDCPTRSTTCIHPENRNVYKIIRSRSYYHCGKACRYATKCENWTFRYHQRKCYLLKSCCRSDRKGFLSGTQYCPVYEGEEARSLNAEDYEEEEEPLNIEEDFDEESMNDEDFDEESD